MKADRTRFLFAALSMAMLRCAISGQPGRAKSRSPKVLIFETRSSFGAGGLEFALSPLSAGAVRLFDAFGAKAPYRYKVSTFSLGITAQVINALGQSKLMKTLLSKRRNGVSNGQGGSP